MGVGAFSEKSKDDSVIASSPSSSSPTANQSTSKSKDTTESSNQFYETIADIAKKQDTSGKLCIECYLDMYPCIQIHIQIHIHIHIHIHIFLSSICSIHYWN